MRELTSFVGHLPSPVDDDSRVPPVPPSAEPDEGPVLQYYWSVLRKHRALIATFFVGTLVATALTLSLIPPTYVSETTLLIERNTPQVLDFREVLAESRGLEQYDFYKTQYEILKSRALAARVIREQGLETEPAFTGGWRDERLSTRFVDAVTEWATMAQGWLRQLLSSPPPPANAEPLAVESALLDIYLGMLAILPTQKTQLVKVAFDTPEPRLSARLANAHAQAYIRQGLERRARANEEAQSFLQEKMEELKERVEQSEAALNRYRQARGIISLDDKENIVVERLADLNRRLIDAEAERIGLEGQVHLVRKRRYESLPAVINSALIQTLTAQAVRFEGEYANLSTVFKPGYARLDQLQAQLADTRRRLKDEIQKVVEGIESSYLAAVAKEKQLRAAMKEQKAAALRFKNVSVDYAILAREVDTNRQLYDSVLQRMKETGVAAELRASNVSIIDQAVPPRFPSKPKVKQSLCLGMLLGLMGGIGLAFLREHLDNSLKSPEEAERYLRLPNLGLVPDFLSLDWRRCAPQRFPYMTSQIPSLLPAVEEPPLALSYHPLFVVTEAYRTLRTAIILSRAEKPPQTLLFTSAMHGEGKTTTVVNTAIVIAQMSANVLLIDADLRRSRCHKILGLQSAPGLTEILTGLREPQELIQPTYTPGLSFLSSGSTPPTPADLVGSKKMQDTLAFLRERYDYILIDSPPVMAVSDAVLLSTMVEGVALVVDVQETPKPRLGEACARLRYARANLLGTILNRVDMRNGHSTYYC
jgi:succinoglycan biosynthesis transport protein ExoP